MLTHEKVQRLLHYEPATGIFTWRVQRGPARPGKRAGNARPDGYWVVCIDGFKYRANRLAWFYVHGIWPDGDVDHADVTVENNAFGNLRDATRSQNMGNCPVRSTNTSGFKGVSWAKNRSCWRADIMKNGKARFLGYFGTPEAAHAAYTKAAETLFGQFARAA